MVLTRAQSAKKLLNRRAHFNDIVRYCGPRSSKLKFALNFDDTDSCPSANSPVFTWSPDAKGTYGKSVTFAEESFGLQSPGDTPIETRYTVTEEDTNRHTSMPKVAKKKTSATLKWFALLAGIVTIVRIATMNMEPLMESWHHSIETAYRSIENFIDTAMFDLDSFVAFDVPFVELAPESPSQLLETSHEQEPEPPITISSAFMDIALTDSTDELYAFASMLFDDLSLHLSTVSFFDGLKQEDSEFWFIPKGMTATMTLVLDRCATPESILGMVREGHFGYVTCEKPRNIRIVSKDQDVSLENSLELNSGLSWPFGSTCVSSVILEIESEPYSLWESLGNRFVGSCINEIQIL